MDASYSAVDSSCGAACIRCCAPKKTTTWEAPVTTAASANVTAASAGVTAASAAVQPPQRLRAPRSAHATALLPGRRSQRGHAECIIAERVDSRSGKVIVLRLAIFTIIGLIDKLPLPAASVQGENGRPRRFSGWLGVN